jgi:L-asparaginase
VNQAGRDRILAEPKLYEPQIFSARDVQKGDARPGGYVTTGGHGGVS